MQAVQNKDNFIQYKGQDFATLSTKKKEREREIFYYQTLNVCVTLKSVCWTLLPSEGIRRYSLWELTKSKHDYEGRGFANGFSALIRVTVHEIPDVQAGLRKGRGTRNLIANIHWIINKARELQKDIYFCFIDCAKAFDRVDHNKLLKILKEMGIPDYLICLLRNLYAGQEAKVRTGHGTTDWFQIGKGVHRGCILSPCLSNLYAEYIMRNAGLDEAQAGIKITGRNINNLRDADDTNLMVESEELESLLLKVKEESEKVGLKLNIQKTKIMASGPITWWQIDG